MFPVPAVIVVYLCVLSEDVVLLPELRLILKDLGYFK